MASSKVMSSTSPANPDLPRYSSSSTTLPTPIPQRPPQTTTHLIPHSDHAVSSFGSMNMEEILKNMYSEPDSLASAVDGGAPPAVSAGGDGAGRNVGGVGTKSVDEVWKEIVTGGGRGGEVGSNKPRMTLEDFLTKAGAVTEEDVRVPAAPPPAVTVGGAGGYGMEAMMNAAAAGVQFPAAPVRMVHMQNGPGVYGMESQLGFTGNGMVAAAVATGSIRGGGGGGGGGASGGGSGRGKRRAPPVEELAVDKATQQKQKRMIKNRESAARSRERKQAYTVELESLVTQLEEENARLLRAEAEQKKERFKQLMENLIPVVEKQRPQRVLRRVRSMSW